MDDGQDNARRKVVDLAPGSAGLTLPRLYFALLRQRFTGTVELEQSEPEPGTRMIWFRGGMPLFTDWVSPSNVLGEILLASRVISPAQHQQALQAMATSGGLLGSVLLTQGHVDARGLADALRIQCQRKLVETFSIHEGSIALDAVEHGRGRDDDLRGQVNVLSLILQGISRSVDESRIRADMGEALDGDLVATPAMPKYQAQFGFRPDDHPIVHDIARGTRLASLRRPGVSESRALSIVYALWCCQMLRTGADASQAIAQGATAAAATQKSRTGNAPPSSQPKSKPAKAAPKEAPTTKKAAEASKPKPKPAASKPKPQPAAPASEFETELAAFEAKIAGEANPFDLFGLELDAGKKQIRGIWSDLSKRFHPDALESSGHANLRERAEPVFAALSEAYGILNSKEKREQLKLVIESGGSGKANEDTGAVVRNALKAEMIARDGDKLLKRSNYARAAEAYRQAIELSPQDFDTQAALVWCEFQLGQKTANDQTILITNLERVVGDQENCARAHYYLGLAYLQMKNDRLARDSLKKALSIDPRMTEADRQLHAINVRMRQAKEERKEESSGLSFKSLFGRKG